MALATTTGQTTGDQGPFVGYFAHVKDNGSYWGALSVQTLEGDPIDFAYTEPVSLNKFSQALLGTRADGYVLTRLLLQPLLEHVRQSDRKPSLLCFEEPLVLLRAFHGPIPGVVIAEPKTAHKEGAWQTHLLKVPAGSPETCWVSSSTPEVASLLDRLQGSMAPFGIREPFRQLRAAMQEVRRETSR